MSAFDVKAPIPQRVFPETDSVKIIDCGESLVCISDTLKSLIEFQPMYYLRGINGATNSVWVRETVADMLEKAAKALPTGLKLKIFDAWRPVAVQKALFDEYYDYLSSKNEINNLNEDDLYNQAIQYVSYPSENPDIPFVHSTGGAVDLTIVSSHGEELDMGTKFDDFSQRAHTAYFENSENYPVRDNRRLLYNTMKSAGFTNLPTEWWHYDFGDRFWGAFNQKDSVYSGIYVNPKRFLD